MLGGKPIPDRLDAFLAGPRDRRLFGAPAERDGRVRTTAATITRRTIAASLAAKIRPKVIGHDLDDMSDTDFLLRVLAQKLK